jgi:Terpene synthase family 2, C-terminal metal binding
MPQDVYFPLPWPLRVNPHLDNARRHNLQWMRHYGLLAEDQASEVNYLGWQLAEVAAYFYPDATQEGLELATDLMGWYFQPFDDQFDGPLGRVPGAVAQVCASFISLLHNPPSPNASPAAVAFADIWQRWQQGMSRAWCARTICNWSEYFAGHITEAQVRCRLSGHRNDTAYMQINRQLISAYPLNDLAERVSEFEVPPALWHLQLLRELREVAADVVTLSQDTASVEKEERDGESGSNLLLILESRDGLTRSECIEEMKFRTANLVQRFLELETEADALQQILSRADSVAVHRYITSLQDWMRGNDEWERASSRYDTSQAPPLHTTQLLTS